MTAEVSTGIMCLWLGALCHCAAKQKYVLCLCGSWFRSSSVELLDVCYPFPASGSPQLPPAAYSNVSVQRCDQTTMGFDGGGKANRYLPDPLAAET